MAHAGGATNSNPFQWLQVTNGVCRRHWCCRCWLCLISQKWIQFVVFVQLANNCVGSCRVKCSSVTTIVTLNTGQHTARGIVRAKGRGIGGATCMCAPQSRWQIVCGVNFYSKVLDLVVVVVEVLLCATCCMKWYAGQIAVKRLIVFTDCATTWRSLI